MSQPLLTPPPSGLPFVPFPEMVEVARHELPDDLPRDLSRVLVALDVDGTLLRPDGASPRVREAYHDLVDAGATVVIATGRGVNAVRPVLGYLHEDRGWSVCSNGAVLARWEPRGGTDVEVLVEHRFDPSAAIRSLESSVPGILLGVEVTDRGYLVSQPFPVGELAEAGIVSPVRDLSATPTPKLIGRAPWMDRDEFAERVEGSDLGVRHEYAVGWTSWVDVGPEGTTKATGLAELAAELGTPREGTVSVGDGTNDIAMLRWAHHGVAMGGATEEVRAHADAVTGPVEHDGAAALMRAILER